MRRRVRGGSPTTHEEIPVRVGDTHQVHALYQRVEREEFERGWRRHGLDHDERVETFDTSLCRIYALYKTKIIAVSFAYRCGGGGRGNRRPKKTNGGTVQT